MLRLILIFISLLSWVFAQQAIPTWQWQKIPAPTKRTLKVISAQSTDEFWLTDDSGWVFHFKQGSWNSIPPPTDQLTVVEMRYFMGNDQLWGAVIDTAFHSHIFLHQHGAWEAFSTERSVPVNGIIPIAEDDVWMYGDWGLLEHFDGRQWHSIDAPVSQHIFTIVAAGDNDLYLGTRNQGIFRYNQGVFHHFPMTSFQSGDISCLVLDNKQQLKLALTSNGKTLQAADSGFMEIPSQLPYRHYNTIRFAQDSIGLAINTNRDLSIYRSGKWRPLQITGNYHLEDGILFSGATGILTGEKGTLLISQGHFEHFFTNTAEQCYIEGGRFDHPIGAGWLDVDGDGWLDLCVLNDGAGQLSRLYLNQTELRFLDETANTGFKTPNLFNRFTIGDINNDGRDDIVGFVQQANTGKIHLIFFSLGVWHHRILTVDLKRLNTPNQLFLYDFDLDGDLDIGITFKYGFAHQQGSLLLLENYFAGRFKPNGTVPDSVTAGWNYFTLISDFTGDDRDDIYLANFWESNKLLVNRDGGFVDETKTRFPWIEATNTIYAAGIDMENDGDLDIFTLSKINGIQGFRNDGTGHFEETTAEWGLGILNSRQSNHPTLNFGDFNNDGYADLFVSNLDSTRAGNRLWINHDGKRFIPSPDPLNLQFPAVQNCLVGDVDNDGDLDIYGIQAGPNALWINNVNNTQYLNIRLEGIGSNRSALGAKVWLYPAGALGDSSQLLGYQQAGSSINQRHSMNMYRIHFGLPDTTALDIRVRFPDGRHVIRRGVSAGQTIMISEFTGFARILLILPATIISILSTPILLYYIFMTLLVILILTITVWLGSRRFHWQFPSLLAVTILNLSAYWVLVFLTNQSEDLLRFTLPIAPVILGTLIPLIWSGKLQSIKRLALTRNEASSNSLLRQLMVFTHGEWAMRNLNSLLLLTNNLLSQPKLTASEAHQLEERITTFQNSTGPAIRKLIETACDSKINDFSLDTLLESLDTLKENFHNITTRLQNQQIPDGTLQEPTANQLTRLKTELRKLRRTVFQKYSCNVRDVVARTTKAYSDQSSAAGVRITQQIQNTGHIYALIPEAALVPILDNLIQNAMRAMENVAEKTLKILIYWHSPKLRIEFEDTGVGISLDGQEKIFTSGYSGWHGTGLGLAQARESLANYGGRIFIKKSSLDEGTSIIIELLEGQEPHEVSFTHH